MQASILRRAAAPAMIALLPTIALPQSVQNLTELEGASALTLPGSQSIPQGLVVGAWVDPSPTSMGSLTGGLYGESGQLEYDLVARLSEFIAPAGGARAGAIEGKLFQGQVPTGILYLEEDDQDMHELEGSIETPLVDVPYAELCPGSEALAKLMNEFR